ncbi:MAG: hypothetical protein CMB25_07420 [Euryarchaeota archaeon]|nr:hypothetical protein [Euryarchaeota archaeon]
MTQKTYRWRTDPDQIARFVHDNDLPRNTPILLRPNEVCVVLENGRIAGIVTQQVMRANPTTSMLRRMFGGKRRRSYLFAFLGPYTVNLPFASKSSDHQTLRGQATVRLCATREHIARIIQLPANGMMEIRVQDLQNMLLAEARAYMARTIQKYSNDDLVQEANEDASIGLSLALRRTVESFGMSIDHTFITWKQSDKVRLEAEREHAINMAEHASIQAEREQINFDAQLATQQRRADFTARSQMAAKAATERAKVEPRIAQIKAEGSISEAEWDNKHRNQAHEAEMARNKATSKAEVLDILRSKELDLRERKQNQDLALAMTLFESVQEKKRMRSKN